MNNIVCSNRPAYVSNGKVIENIEYQADFSDESSSPNNVTTLYLCATCWHENNNEMLQLLKSLMRMDADQAESKKLGTRYNFF